MIRITVPFLRWLIDVHARLATEFEAEGAEELSIEGGDMFLFCLALEFARQHPQSAAELIVRINSEYIGIDPATGKFSPGAAAPTVPPWRRVEYGDFTSLFEALPDLGRSEEQP